MKKTILRLLCVLLSLSLFASIAACGASGYTVTGEIEDGELVVWLSPNMTQDIQMTFPKSTAMSANTYFSSEITFVQFETDEEFRQALAQKILSNEGPDVILAAPEELTSKILRSDTLMDLTPFFDYADKTGTIPKDDLMTSVMDFGKYQGKLYLVPLSFNATCFTATISNDQEKGLNLIGHADLAFDEFISGINNWIQKNGSENSYQISPAMLPVHDAFKNFIDYENMTTRMDEDATYEYYCNYVQSQTAKTDINSLYTRITGDADTKDPEAFLNWYNSVAIYDGGLAYAVYTRIPSSKNEDTRDSSIEQIEYVTDYGSGELVVIKAVAAIPANAKKKEKAFEYISTAFKKDVYANDFYAFWEIPMLKSVIKEDISTIGYLSSEEKDALYQHITETDYIYTWQDPQILEWFSEYCETQNLKYVYTSYQFQDSKVIEMFYQRDVKMNQIVPTRDEWNALKEKIELYLNE